MADKSLKLNGIRISRTNREPLAVRTLEVGLTFKGQDISIVLPAEHLENGTDSYFAQAEEFFRLAADEIADFRRRNAARTKKK